MDQRKEPLSRCDMRYRFSSEDCKKGGKARARQPDFVDACRKGFEKTMETHPFFARHHLKRIIKNFNARRKAQA